VDCRISPRSVKADVEGLRPGAAGKPFEGLGLTSRFGPLNDVEDIVRFRAAGEASIGAGASAPLGLGGGSGIADDPFG
jgi:hypothetical protein